MRLQLTTDLHLSNSQYAICLSVFFVSYAFFEVPSNILLKQLKPHIWFPAIMITWGFITTMIGIAAGFSGLAVARFFLGLAEGGL